MRFSLHRNTPFIDALPLDLEDIRVLMTPSTGLSLLYYAIILIFTMRYASWIFFVWFVGIVGCGGAPPPKPKTRPVSLPKKSPPNEPCENFKAQMDGVWNDDTLERLDLTVRIYKGELDASDGERIVSELNALSERWVALRTEACQTHNEDLTMKDADYAQLVSCLDTKLCELEKKLNLFVDGDVSALTGILNSLDDCQL
jgi:hypothetical protein